MVASYTQPYQQTVDSNAALSGENIVARWERVVNDHNEVHLEAYWDRTNRREANFEEVRNTFDVDLLQHLRLPYHQQVSWGLGARVDPVDDTEVTSGLQFLPLKRTDYLVSAFVQDEVGLVDRRLALILGAKLVRTNYTGFEPQPSIRLRWTPSDRQTVWAAFTHALRAPSDAEEDFYLLGYQTTLANGTPYFARFNANTNFAPEQLNGFEVGYRRLLGQTLYVDLSTFYNHYHNLFSEDITGGPYEEDEPAPTHLLLPAQFQNGLDAYTKGIEVAPEWRPSKAWRLRGSYSYLHMDVYNKPDLTAFIQLPTGPTEAGSSPRHQVAVQSAFDLTKRWQVDLSYRYVSALPGLGVASYCTGDARIGYRLGQHAELSVVGQNLLQPWHLEYAQSEPGPPVWIRRSVYARLTWSR